VGHYCVGGEYSVARGWDINDGQGIFLCRACDLCRNEKLAKYRPEILQPYTQADVDEPIEEDQ
jgi:hypothetical protein